ncbi:MAG: transketolase C-terminal domain-containing protein, partial [Ardenticatenia bacterium]|nr:transketolase C-terminal domain-containing protein [Ardenticatenia bacterium]
RALDIIEETKLTPAGEVLYQFSAAGHELSQVLLGLALDHPHDGATVYYRSRPFMLAVGLTVEEIMATGMAKAGSINNGRDSGVVYHKPGQGRVTVLPMSGNVGAQYSPAAGWAQSIRYYVEELGEKTWAGAMSVALGGDGSVAANGFWAALNIVTTLRLPMLFFIEDNKYAISVTSDLQTPGGNIVENLASFKNLALFQADGTLPEEAAKALHAAVTHVRSGEGPALLRVTVPRLRGHSFTDNQAYKPEEVRREEEARDPLRRLREYLVPAHMSSDTWETLEQEVRCHIEAVVEEVRARPEPDPASVTRHVFFEEVPQQQGGLLPEGMLPPPGTPEVRAETPVRMNLIDAVRHTLEVEMHLNPRVLVFGEDVAVKGGVHGATRGLLRAFGPNRVFDTSLNEDGIIGRAVGMAIAGLLPVPEIQFRKYLDPATEQINDAGTIRWRTANRFAAPMVVRIPIGYGKVVSDPWHCVCDESVLAHKSGWRIAIPSNAQDAVGLLRAALRGNDPTLFLEHRALLDTSEARRPYPGDDYTLPFGQAAILQEGDDATVVTWGAMVYRCLEAANAFPGAVEVIDLRTIVPWDKETVLRSVRKTARCLIVHEDSFTVGFGAEIAATVAHEAFLDLDAPIMRVAGPDCPVPYNRRMEAHVVPTVERIRAAIEELLGF